MSLNTTMVMANKKLVLQMMIIKIINSITAEQLKTDFKTKYKRTITIIIIKTFNTQMGRMK